MVAHLVYESGNDGSSCNMLIIWVKSMGKETVFFFLLLKSTQPVMIPSKTQCWNSQEKKEILFKGPSLRKQPTLDAITGFPVKWHLRHKCRNSILMICHYPDLGSTSDWSCNETNLYGISAVIPQMPFCMEPSKFWLFFQASWDQAIKSKMSLISTLLTCLQSTV